MALQTTDLDSIINHQVAFLSTVWIMITYCGIDCPGTAVDIFWIVTIDINWSIMVMNDFTVITNYTNGYM